MENINFEVSLKRLSEIVRILEQNETALDDSLKLFEEGVGLVKECHKKLTNVEKKIEVLTQIKTDGVETKPYGQ